MIGLFHYLTIGAVLFSLGLIGFMSRRNMIVMFLSIEMMLQGVAINFVAFSRFHGNLHGQVFTLFIVAVAACEAGFALALILSLYRTRRSLDVSLWQELREPGIDATHDPEPVTDVASELDPHLAVAGVVPESAREDRHV